MVQSISNIPAADFIINRDPWLRRFGARQAGKLISEALFESTPPILRGRPIYDRLPGTAEAYNKDNNNFLSKGTIIIPEARTNISSAEDLYFRDKFPSLYEDRDYVTGSYFGPGSGAALYEDGAQKVQVSDAITNRPILLRSAVLFWPRAAIRDSSDVSKQSIKFDGAIISLPDNGSGWFWLDGKGILNVTESLPDGIANLTGNIWCDPNASSELGQRACVQRVITFQRSTNYLDTLDVGLTPDEITWPPVPESEENYATEVAALFRYTTEDGILTRWEDFRTFNRSFEPPVSKWITDYWDNILQEKKEQIDTFVDDALNPDTIGFNFIGASSGLRNTYKPDTFNKILEAWDFGLITPEERNNGLFSFLELAEIEELDEYDFQTNKWLDWLAQHFGFQDNGTTNNNYWHNGSFYTKNLRDNEVYFTIAEKRAILRNALSQDAYQDYVDVGTPIVTNPIWSTFREFYDRTQLFWDRELNTPANNFEFKFTRFPFTVYDRIKPSEWFGLQRAKGTIKAIEFMFDVLGLHGYACNEDKPRFYSAPVDYDTPLLVFKFANSVTVETRKILEDGNIVDAKTEPLYNTQGYEETGIFRVGETIFQEGYDRKILVRAPFSWDRTSQNWNRLQEIKNTYARPGELVTGYYQFLSGRSAIGEPVWLPENCTSCTFNISTKLLPAIKTIDTTNFEEAAIRNNVSNNEWKNIGIDDEPFLFSTHSPIEFSYIEERTIIAGLEQSIESDDSDFFNDLLPVVISYDNGKSYEYVKYNLDTPIDYVERIRVYGNNIYVIGRDAFLEETLITSNNNTESWNKLASNLNFEGARFLDIVHDLDARKIYLLTSKGLYFRYDNNLSWSKILTHDIGAISVANLGASGTDTPDFKKGSLVVIDRDIYVFLLEDTKNILTVQKSFNEGENWFLEFNDVLEQPQVNNSLTPQKNIKAIINNNAEATESYILVLYTPRTIDDKWEVYSINDFNGYTKLNIKEEIKTAIINSIEFDINGPISIEVTDINYNYSNNRWEYLVTYKEGGFYLEGFIVSSDKNFGNFLVEQSSIELNYQPESFNPFTQDTTPFIAGSITGDFIRKIQTTIDIDAEPIKEDILVKVDDDFQEIFAPVFLNNDSSDLYNIFNPDAHFEGFNYVSWNIPRLRSSFDFSIDKNNIKVRSTNLTDNKKLKITATATTETDTFSIFYSLIPVKGLFLENNPNSQNGFPAQGVNEYYGTAPILNFSWGEFVNFQYTDVDTQLVPFGNNSEFSEIYEVLQNDLNGFSIINRFFKTQMFSLTASFKNGANVIETIVFVLKINTDFSQFSPIA